ncbi:MAG: phosphate signaling complex protein PhoU, partial [Actinobacteria bacterium]|nr:phosphate signaling complex protein PhoU [Actinomycetota bacterium]
MIRVGFHEELENAETRLLTEGGLVRTQLVTVVEALLDRNLETARVVIQGDDRIDDLYLETQARILNLLALQAPVAADLRLVSAILHSNMHIERMGDLCVNIAKFVLNRHPYPSDSAMTARLNEMGQRAAEMLDTALSAFVQRSVELAEQLTFKDDSLDRLNKGMLGDLKKYAGDEQAFEWATNLVLVA